MAERLDVPPEILKFARQIRDVFGPGVKLHKPVKWPGGSNGR